MKIYKKYLKMPKTLEKQGKSDNYDNEQILDKRFAKGYNSNKFKKGMKALTKVVKQYAPMKRKVLPGQQLEKSNE